MDTADSAKSGAGNILSRVVRRSRKVLGLGFRSNKQPSSSGNLSSPTSSKALEVNEGPAGPKGDPPAQQPSQKDPAANV